MTSDLKVVDSVFPGCRTARALPLKNVDTISGRFLGENAFSRYGVVDGEGVERDVVIKRKNDLVVPLGAMGFSPNIGIFMKVVGAHRIFGFDNGQKREKLFYEKVDDSLRGYLPKILGVHESIGGRNVALVMAKFDGDREAGENDLAAIIDAITDFHAKYYGKREAAREMSLNCYSPEDYRHARGVLRALFDYYRDANEKVYGSELIKVLGDFIDNIDREYAEVMHERTLTHNDFTLRNIAICGDKVIIYDWELACYQNPEHDLVELLISGIDENADEKRIKKLTNYFREQIEDKTRRNVDDVEFAKILRFNALEYCVNRLAIYRSYCVRNHSDAAKKYEKNARKILEVCV